jgi:hypothetical protein
MEDLKYDGQQVPERFRAFFVQLRTEFPGIEYWVRYENFRRKMSAGLVNRTNLCSVTILLFGGGFERTSPLSSEEIQKAKLHLANGSQAIDLAI